MLDGIMNAAKGYFPGRFLFFAVAAAVTHALWQLVDVGGFDPMMWVKFIVSVVVGTLLASMIMGTAD
ncbi:MAG: hypothetical protein ACTSU8_01235 [Alphaproteobacteria bacterium]